MPFRCAWIACWAICPVVTIYAQLLDFTTTAGVVYMDAKLVRIDPDGLHFRLSNGIGKINFTNLPDHIQAEYNFDPFAASSYRREQQQREAKWRANNQVLASDHLDYYEANPVEEEFVYTPTYKTSYLASPSSSAYQPRLPSGNPFVTAYRTYIDSDDDDVWVLGNDAVIKIDDGFVGYIGYQTDCILFEDAYGWKIWVEGEGSFSCEVLRDPEIYTSTVAEKVFVQNVKADGEILLIDDGRVYEVDDTINSSLWLSGFDGLLIDDSELINLDESDEAVYVTQIR